MMPSTTLECIRSLDQKMGKRWRFHKCAIDDWLRQHPEHLDEKREAKE